MVVYIPHLESKETQEVTLVAVMCFWGFSSSCYCIMVCDDAISVSADGFSQPLLMLTRMPMAGMLLLITVRLIL